MFAPTVTTTESTTTVMTTESAVLTGTTTESMTIVMTTENELHIQQQKVHKKTTENTHNPSVCFPAFLFCQFTMWCLRGCMHEQFIQYSLHNTHAHTNCGYGYFSNHFFCFVCYPLKDHGGVLLEKQQDWSMTQCSLFQGNSYHLQGCMTLPQHFQNTFE